MDLLEPRLGAREVATERRARSESQSLRRAIHDLSATTEAAFRRAVALSESTAGLMQGLADSPARHVENAVTFGILVEDGLRAVIRANSAARRLLGLQEMGRPLDLAMVDEDHQQLRSDQQPAAVAFATGALVRDYVIGLADESGAVRWLRWDAMPVAVGAEIWIVSSFVEVTARHDPNEQLSHAQRVEVAAEIARLVSHKLSNALSPLSVYAELIKARSSADPQVAQLCNALMAGVQGVAAINEQLLDLVRRGRLDDDLVDPATVVREVLEQQRSTGTIPSDALWDVQVQAPKLLPAVRASRAELQTAIASLLRNGVEALADSSAPKLRVTVEEQAIEARAARTMGVPPGAYVRIDVTDNGRGMDTATRRRAFDPYFTTKANAAPTAGLGLTQAQAVVAALGGTIELHSRVGSGTTVTVHLPCTYEGVAQAADPAHRGKGEAVLVVDGNAVQRMLLIEQLSGLGYRVGAVATAEEALTYLRISPADLVIMGTMPRSGVSEAELMRATRPGGLARRVLVAAGDVNGSAAQRLLGLGADGAVPTPARIDALAGAVRSVLDAA
ncbi:MAG: two-component system, cell cycle sensor histidine kinase and response regulator CckA [Chloroflexota bacterium]|nr:two-component system, cell cycle sensor histidine kinase and response regulator CckA [Chloroflexota bacterium]